MWPPGTSSPQVSWRCCVKRRIRVMRSTGLSARCVGRSLTVPGSMGQLRPNPLLKVLQDHRLLLRRLVDSLNLPDESQASGSRPAARHAQKAANVRWRERNSWHAARGVSA